MTWTLDADRPIYAQIVEQLKRQIVSGGYLPGEKLPTVRELAAEAAVNPNTMQRAFAELERSGLVVTQRTAGRSVTWDQAVIEEARRALADEMLEQFCRNMRELGYSSGQLLDAVAEKVKGGEGNG